MASVFERMQLKKYNGSVKKGAQMTAFSIHYNGIVGREVMKLLRIPLEHYNNVLTLLKFDHYSSVIQSFDYRGALSTYSLSC